MSRRIGSYLEDILRDYEREILRSVANTLEDTGENAKSSYMRDIANWDGKPVFTVNVVDTGESLQLTVAPTGENAQKWIWVDEGTGLHGENRRAYPIRAVFASALKFQTGYSAKTVPVARGNVGDGSRSGSWVSTPIVMHPGIEGRKFADTYFQETIDAQEVVLNGIQDGIDRVR